jgi:hypothetical protein
VKEDGKLLIRRKGIILLRVVLQTADTISQPSNINSGRPTTRTCCSINGEEALGVPRDKTIRDSLLGILIVVGGIELDDFGASWAVFRHRWIINGLLRQRHIIVLVVDLNKNLSGRNITK